VYRILGGDYITNAKRTILSNEEKIGLEIYGSNVESKEIYFSKLTDLLKDEISRSTISKVIDKLFDLGMVTAKWENENGKWVRSLYITGEYKEFFQHLYDIQSDEI